MKLYWRYKKDGKWTWKAAYVSEVQEVRNWIQVWDEREEEE